jgi:hypothetical protein
MATGGIVASVAAIGSYLHMQHLAWAYATGDQKWFSYLQPLSVDGLVVLATIVIIQERKQPRGGKVSVLAVLSLAIGLLVSLAANFVSSMNIQVAPDSTWTPTQLVDIWPPISLALSFELILRCAGLSSAKVAKVATRKTTVKKDSFAAAADPDAIAAAEEPTRVAPANRDEVSAADPAATGSEMAASSAGATPLAPMDQEQGSRVTTLHLESPRPEWLIEDMQPRDAMKRYLDENGDMSGAELDKLFGAWIGTKPSLGRKARQEWTKEREHQMASGE